MGIAKRNGKFGSRKGGLSARQSPMRSKTSTQQRISGDYRKAMAKLKPQVLQRDDFTCKSCFRSIYTSPDIILTVDHTIPVARGGRTTLGNLRCICIDCHIKKVGKTNRQGANLLKGLKKKIIKDRISS